MPLACLQKPGIAAGHFFGGNPVGDPSTPFLRAWIPATFPLHQSIDPANPCKSQEAVEHADGAFVFASAGPFRSTALLFVRLLDDDAREVYQSKDRGLL